MRPAADRTDHDNEQDGRSALETRDTDRSPRHNAWWHDLPATLQRLRARALRLSPVAIAYHYIVTAQGFDLAAGTAFRLLTYLIPLIGSVLATIGFVLRDSEVRAQISDAIISLMPSGFHPSVDTALTTTRDHAGLIAIGSIFILLWIGSSLFSCLSRAFNQIYAAPPRGVVANRIFTFALLLLIPPLFVIAVIVSNVANAAAEIVATLFDSRTQRVVNAGHLTQIVSLATVWLLGFALALVLFWGLPNVRQGFRDVWPGAALAAALLVATNQLFPLYVRIAFGNQYSAMLLLLAVATTWAYLVANVLLIGVTVNAFNYRRKGGRPM